MDVEAGYPASDSWLTRITGSATGLTKDLLSIDNGYETTESLTALQPASKTGYVGLTGNAFSERQPKLLSNRHKANGTFRTLAPTSDLLEEAELEDEIATFLGRSSYLNHGHASSSRSGSPQSSLYSDWDTATAGQSNVRQIHNESAQATELHSSKDYTDYRSLQTEDGNTAHRQEQLAAFLAEREAIHFDTHWNTLSGSIEATTSSSKSKEPQLPLVQKQLASQAARRLELITHHLNRVSMSPQAPLRPATFADLAGYESSYNHLATLDQQPLVRPSQRAGLSGLESSYKHIANLTGQPLTHFGTTANLAAFETSYNHIANLTQQPTLRSTAITNMSALDSSYSHISRVIQQTSQTASTYAESQSESAHGQFCPGEMSAEWADFLAQGPFCLNQDLQRHNDGQDVSQKLDARPNMQGYNDIVIDRTRPTEKNREAEEQQKKEEAPMPPFHCPWVGCQHVRPTSPNTIHDHTNSQQYFDTGYQYVRGTSGELEALACVHVECDEAFTEEAEWREHVLSPHHGLQRTPPNEPSDDAAFEQVWESTGRS